MGKTINILGETAREQWKNAIMIYNVTIESNVIEAQRLMCHYDDAEGANECLDTAIRVLGEYRAEIVRLVEGVFNED